MNAEHSKTSRVLQHLRRARRFSLPHRARRRTKPGEVPGRVAVDPEAQRPVIRVIAYGPDEIAEAEIDNVQELDQYLDKYSVTWVNIDGLGDADTIRRIGRRFALHSLSLEDVVNVHQRAKVEEFDEYVFLVARMCQVVEDALQTEQISIFLGDRFLITFQERPGDCLDPVRERLRKSRGKIRTREADYLAYAIFDAVIDGYFPVIDELAQRLDELDERLERRVTGDVAARVHQLRRDLLLVHRSIWPHRDAVNNLSRLEESTITDETRLFLRDCNDHTLQIIEVVETYRELCADVREMYVSTIGLRLNEVMKFLTLIATVFIPLNFLAALYGMNFDTRSSPWNMPELHAQYGYPIVLGLMAVISLVMLGFFWRRGWLRE